ncbi:hypothetical protein AAHK20_14245 [Trinickia sp. YCB016]
MATELKTDSWHRYMLYQSDERYMRFETEEDRKQAADSGKKFVMSAYPEVWAGDVDLVKRIRAFLGENFHWHDRLSKSGTDLEVVDTLFEMVRGGSVIVIPEDAPRGGSIGAPAASAQSSFWGVENYDDTPFVSLKDRYLAQLERLHAERSTSAEIQAMMDGINAGFMQAMFRAVPLASSILFSKAGWISKYGVPDLSDIGPDNAAIDSETPLGGAQPFEYQPLDTSGLGDSFTLAKTPNEGAPGTWYTNPGSGQMRLYGGNGKPVVDFDFDHDHGQGIPHAHNWAIDPFTGKPRRGPGLPMSILP